MKFCSNCGTQNDDNTAFCATCGKPFAASAPQQAPAPQYVAPQPKVHNPNSANPFVAFKGIAFILLITAIAVMGWGLIAGIIELVKLPTGYKDFYITLKYWFNSAQNAATILFFAAVIHYMSKKSK